MNDTGLRAWDTNFELTFNADTLLILNPQIRSYGSHVPVSVLLYLPIMPRVPYSVAVTQPVAEPHPLP